VNVELRIRNLSLTLAPSSDSSPNCPPFCMERVGSAGGCH